MNKILQDLELPGSITRPVVIRRTKISNSNIDKILDFQLELELPPTRVDSDSHNKKE